MTSIARIWIKFSGPWARASIGHRYRYCAEGVVVGTRPNVLAWRLNNRISVDPCQPYNRKLRGEFPKVVEVPENVRGGSLGSHRFSKHGRSSQRTKLEDYRCSLECGFLYTLLLMVSPALSQEHFYKDKTIHILVGASPGGIFDSYCES